MLTRDKVCSFRRLVARAAHYEEARSGGWRTILGRLLFCMSLSGRFPVSLPPTQTSCERRCQDEIRGMEWWGNGAAPLSEDDVILYSRLESHC